MMIISILTIAIVLSRLETLSSSALSPRVPKSEDEFLKLNHHERTLDDKTMYEKIKVVKDRRSWKSFTIENPYVKNILNDTKHKQYPNILFMFADDLGYGDLSVPPFTAPADGDFPCTEGGGILSPNLERMAANGMILTNFHSAAPVCSPSRVAVMTSLYPWRLNAMNAFELGNIMSQRNGFLPQVPTTPEILREYGYYTAHSGKWHLGGMREEMRVDRVYHDKCTYGSPNQHGFEEYISELDGPESARYTFLHRSSIGLHTYGHRHLLRDDIPVPADFNDTKPRVLSDREASDAIQIMRKIHQQNLNHENNPQPWFIQVWFNFPHSPWELMRESIELYSQHYSKTPEYWENNACPLSKSKKDHIVESKAWKYKTMVTAMDKSIGMLLDELKRLNIEENTLVVFTSDNGQEDGAGIAGLYKEGKRSLMEGGIRVPCFFQWTGIIPKGTISSQFGSTVDLLPTFLDAAKVSKPVDMRIDGVSLLPALLNLDSSSSSLLNKKNQIRQLNHHHHKPGHHTDQYHNSSSSSSSSSLQDPFYELNERIHLWHKDTDPFPGRDRVNSASQYKDIKLITSSYKGCLERIYDMKHDQYESYNLYNTKLNRCSIHFDQYNFNSSFQNILNAEMISRHCQMKITAHHSSNNTKTMTTEGVNSHINRCILKYTDSVLQKLKYMFPKLVTFAKNGDLPLKNHMKHDLNKAICSVPFVSEIKRIPFEEGCLLNDTTTTLSSSSLSLLSCSIPMH